MGFRYRKSINLGGGFRINISKSGVGYSWGVKGYRVTKTAKGTVRRTVSIPGTGISYTEESRTDKPRPAPSNVRTIDTNHYAAQEIANSDATQMVSSGVEELLAAAKRTISVDKNATIGIVVFFLLMFSFPPFLLGALLCIALKIYARTAGLINLDYEIDSDQLQVVAQRMEPMVRLSESKKIWRIMQSSRVIDTKYSGGAGHIVKRIDCQTSRTPPFPFKSDADVVVFKTSKEILLFLPDKLFILQGRKIGALNYSDISTSARTTRFIEDKAVPKDSQVVGQTWQYVNKSGGPDKRFKNNRRLPICLYGELELHSASGLNTVIMFSNAQLR